MLVVEDHPETRLFLYFALRDAYQVNTAAGVDEALQEATHRRHDAFVLDIALGSRWEGIDVLPRLRATPGHLATPALAITAYTLPEDHERFRRLGFDAYLSKPFFPVELLGTLDRLVSTRLC